MATQDFFSKHWLAGVLVLLFLLNAIWMIRMAGHVESVAIGRDAPDFGLRVVAGESVGRDLALSDLRGKIVLVDFWSPYCEPCLDALPSLAALDREYRDRGVSVIGVATQESEIADVRSVVRDKGVRFPILFDEKDEVRARYAVDAVPALFVVDRHGAIRDVDRGARPLESLVRVVRPLLSDP